MAQFPQEIWYMVADNLNVFHVKSFLGISKLHRTIAQRLLFSDIEVFFGAPEIAYHEIMMTEDTINRCDEDTMNRTWEILSAIRLDPCFAQVVRKLTIHTTINGPDFSAFYRRAICEALQALPHLMSFTWDSDSHALPVQLLESFITCCPNLRTISFPINQFPSSNVLLSELKHIENLILREGPRWLSPRDTTTRLLPHLEQIAKTHNIKSLVTPTSILWKISIRMFENLTQLEVTSGLEVHNLGLVFHHAERLQSLAFIDPGDHTLFRMLAENASKLPLLVSFKVKTEWDGTSVYSVQHFLQMFEFLKTKVHLRRLDVNLNCDDIRPFLNCLRELPSIEVLGLFTGSNNLTEEEYSLLARFLPPKTTALRLSTRWEITPENREAADVLIQRFNDLSFLHLRNFGLPPPYLENELASQLKNLLILGLDDRFFYVDRPMAEYADNGGGSQSVIGTICWPWRRAEYRTVTDFCGCEDYEWLMRYHCRIE